MKNSTSVKIITPINESVNFFPLDKIAVDIDSEFRTETNEHFQTLTVQLNAEGFEPKIYLHPNAPKLGYKWQPFKYPNVILDYLVDSGYRVRQIETEKPNRNSVVIELFSFFSQKDYESLYSTTEEYLKNFVPCIQQKRRTSLRPGVKNIPLGWEIETKKGWAKLVFTLTDNCALMGAISLKEAAQNTSVKMSSKELFTRQEKGVMDIMAIQRPQEFEEYALGDVCTEEGKPLLQTIKTASDAQYKQVAATIGITDLDKFAMSLGKQDAIIFSLWLANNYKLKKALTDASKKYKKPVDALFHNATMYAGSQSISDMGKLGRNKMMATYLSICDGGRAVKATDKNHFEGVLVDIDISGCYGNGLRNQVYAVGNPTVYTDIMKLKDFLKFIDKEGIPGLWYARISWKNAPFRQDVLISKQEKNIVFENGSVFLQEDDDGLLTVDEGECLDVNDYTFDAAMVLTENEVHQAALTHDLLQILKPVRMGGTSSNDEWTWLLENASITGLVIYEKRNEVTRGSVDQFAPTIYSSTVTNTNQINHKWVGIDLEPLVSVLLAERQKHPKKTPMNTMIKLIINALYGVMASQYFTGDGTGVSNLVVGNNITGRARALAWLMEKTLGTKMSITDGGVFNVNETVHWNKKSLDNAVSVVYGVDSYDCRHKFYENKPLFGEIVSEIDNTKDAPHSLQTVDKLAWQHVKSQFPKLDITSKDQFSFESKC